MEKTKRTFQEYKDVNPDELNEIEFRDLERKLNNPKKGTIYDCCLDFFLWQNKEKSRAESFADYVTKQLNGVIGLKILEVGAGRTAMVSKILSKRGAIMTCIDPKLDIGKEKNITYLKEKFDYRKFNIDSFDYVIAQEPCEGAEHVIRACKKANKPYIITLCGTPHRVISGKRFKDYVQYHEYLRDLDKGNNILKYENGDSFAITSNIIRKVNKSTKKELD